MPRDEAHGLGDGVEGDVLLVLASLPHHLQREVLVVGVTRPLDGVVRQQQEDVLRQDAALLARSVFMEFIMARGGVGQGGAGGVLMIDMVVVVGS